MSAAGLRSYFFFHQPQNKNQAVDDRQTYNKEGSVMRPRPMYAEHDTTKISSGTELHHSTTSVDYAKVYTIPCRAAKPIETENTLCSHLKPYDTFPLGISGFAQIINCFSHWFYFIFCFCIQYFLNRSIRWLLALTVLSRHFLVPIIFGYLTFIVFKEFSFGYCWRRAGPANGIIPIHLPHYSNNSKGLKEVFLPNVHVTRMYYSSIRTTTGNLEIEEVDYPTYAINCTTTSKVYRILYKLPKIHSLFFSWIYLFPEQPSKNLVIEKSVLQDLISSLKQILPVTISHYQSRITKRVLQIILPSSLSLLLKNTACFMTKKMFGLTIRVVNSYHKYRIRTIESSKSNLPNVSSLIKILRKRLIRFELSGIVQEALANSTATRALLQHTKEFERRITQVVNGVYVGIGYGLANSIIIETFSGIIIVDTLESPNAMRQFINDWKSHYFLQKTNEYFNISAVCKKKLLPSLSIPAYNSQLLNLSQLNTFTDPHVLAVIYTHYHSDHVFGASEVVKQGVTQVWAHESTEAEIQKVFSVVSGVTYKRSMFQFGTLITHDDGFLNAGIGNSLKFSSSQQNSSMGVVAPTHVWKGIQKTLEIDGVTLKLLFAPGESRDQTVIWMKDKNILIGADNLYKSFPNIYAIRGTESRDTMLWVKSLDMMRFLKPKYLILGHGGVLYGKQYIWDTLTVYRDAIQYIHDQTVRQMNKGKSINDIVAMIELPPHLKNHPYLQSFYGTVGWAVRAVYHHYVGWFSGRAEDLNSLKTTDRAQKMAELVGGWVNLLEKALEALEAGHYQWCLELATFVRSISPHCSIARHLRILSLKALAAQQTSASGRNWYLTAAKEATEEEKGNMFDLPKRQQQRRGLYHKFGFQSKYTSTSLWQTRWKTITGGYILWEKRKRAETIREKVKVSEETKVQCINHIKTIQDTFKFLPVRIKAEKSLHLNAVVQFIFTNSNEYVCAHFRYGIGYTSIDCERSPNITVITTSDIWRELLLKKMNPIFAVTTGKLRVLGCNPLNYLLLKKIFSIVDFDY